MVIAISLQLGNVSLYISRLRKERSFGEYSYYSHTEHKGQTRLSFSYEEQNILSRMIWHILYWTKQIGEGKLWQEKLEKSGVTWKLPSFFVFWFTDDLKKINYLHSYSVLNGKTVFLSFPVFC